MNMNILQLMRMKMVKDPINGLQKSIGLNLEFVKIVGWQILVALCLLSMPNVNIIHSDLKPENIMVRELGKTGIKIIDFGNACF
jgi:serine/threonine protein kinase